jgi:hypothetical protein
MAAFNEMFVLYLGVGYFLKEFMTWKNIKIIFLRFFLF